MPRINYDYHFKNGISLFLDLNLTSGIPGTEFGIWNWGFELASHISEVKGQDCHFKKRLIFRLLI